MIKKSILAKQAGGMIKAKRMNLSKSTPIPSDPDRVARIQQESRAKRKSGLQESRLEREVSARENMEI